MYAHLKASGPRPSVPRALEGIDVLRCLQHDDLVALTEKTGFLKILGRRPEYGRRRPLAVRLVYNMVGYSKPVLAGRTVVGRGGGVAPAAGICHVLTATCHSSNFALGLDCTEAIPDSAPKDRQTVLDLADHSDLYWHDTGYL